MLMKYDLRMLLCITCTHEGGQSGAQLLCIESFAGVKT